MAILIKKKDRKDRDEKKKHSVHNESIDAT
jgi:hypothetical protein